MARTRGRPRPATRGRGISNRNAANAVPPTDFRPTSSTADLTPLSRSPLRGNRGKTATSNKPKNRGRKPGLNAALLHLQKQLFNGPEGLGIKNGENRDYIPGLGFVFSSNQQPEEPSEVQEFVEDEENMGVLETYERYKPSKLTLGLDHPDVVVETSSLAGVNPPDIHYKICIPETTINQRLLSSLQLESIFYACQQHEKILPNGQRAGFLIGDGAGVGKGRTVAGVIFENFLKGRKKAIWISISSDLKYDAERDLRDIGAHRVNVHALNKMKYAPISSEVNGCIKDGVIFSTYSSLISETHAVSGLRSRLDQLVDWCGQDFDGVIIFDECHKAKNLLPSGSAKGTKTGAAVVKLQDCLPKARVVYASATGASEPRNMAYMTRLGLWGEGTPFKDFHEFLTLVDRRGVGRMEVVAMEMKLRGMYIARQLSFEGVRFSIDEVPLTPEFIELYDKCVALWVKLFRAFHEGARLMLLEKRGQKTMWGQFWSSHQRFFKYLCIAAKVGRVVQLAEEAVRDGKCVVIGLQSTGEARTLDQLDSDGELSDFVSSAKGVLQALVDKHFPAPANYESLSLLCDNSEPLLEWPALNKAENQVKRKELAFSPVEQESCSKKLKTDAGMEESFKCEDFDILDEDGDVKQPVASKKKEWYDSDSDSSDIETKVQKAVGFQIKGPGFQVKGPRVAPSVKAAALKKELMADIETLGPQLPMSTLDQLINDLGGKENVAEMTGRKGRVVENGGQIIYELRAESDIPLEILNIREKERFMNGEKLIAIISEAASSGISLQADRRALNQRQRVHITLELPWSADRAIQQFGRTHRSNQVSAPYYIFLISDLAGERRFASAVAKRLESLGALTHGDRRATETRDLSQFNVDNRYGNEALRTVMNAVLNIDSPIVQPPADYQGNFFEDVCTMLEGVGLVRNSENDDADVPDQEDVTTMDKKATSIPRFLNRILGLPVDLQNRLFKYFTDTLDAVIEKAKRENRYDRGILDLGSGDQDVIDVELYTLPRKLSTGVANTEIHVVDVQRGMKWEKAEEKFLKMKGEHEGFYSWGGKFGGQYRSAVLVELTNKTRSMGRGREEPLYTIYKPNLGHQVKPLTLPEIRSNHKKITRTEAELLWKSHYEESKTVCSHWKGKCPTASGVRCEYGLSQCRRNILRGSVLTVWTKVEAVVSKAMGGLRRMQVVRLRGGKTILVGTLIPHSCLKQVMDVISEEAEEVKHVLLSNS